MRNIDGSFNKKLIEHTVEVNIYYQGYRERMEIDVIGSQKQSVILGMPQLACHNSEIDWKTGKVKMTRCPEKCEKQWRLKQKKPEQKKQKKRKKRGRRKKTRRKEAKEEERKKKKEKNKEREDNKSKEDSRRVGDLG